MSAARLTARIVCLGSRLVAEDSVGPAVYDRLKDVDLPHGIEAVDGGVRGLDLLPYFEGVQHVVVVDALRGYAHPGEALILRAAAMADLPGAPYDHAGGLAYLLKTLPYVLPTVPEITLVGIEIPASLRAVDAAAAAAIEICRTNFGVAQVALRGVA